MKTIDEASQADKDKAGKTDDNRPEKSKIDKE